ncbi:MAG: hypothetical protein JKY37_00595 [Nannocystaceae bacterium]|nr:hypothetical protein [Nannocystaceae bacterium]
MSVCTSSTFSAILLVAVLGCNASPALLSTTSEEDTRATTTATLTETDSATAMTEHAPGPQRDEDSDDTGGPDDSPVSFLLTPDGNSGGTYECDLRTQECPPGHKCNIWASDGGTWNATRCFALDNDPDEVGEQCRVEGGAASGMDSCVLGALCWDVNPSTDLGVCKAYCQGTADNPICEDPETLCGGPRDFPLCLDLCCPVAQDCPLGQACYPESGGFSCLPDVGGESGAFGDPCRFINVCDPGLICWHPELVPDCDGGGCCTPMCELGTTECSDLDSAMDCLPWYQEGHAPPGMELVGVCGVPG